MGLENKDNDSAEDFIVEEPYIMKNEKLSFGEKFKREFRRACAEFNEVSNKTAPIIFLIYIIAILVAMYIDVTQKKEIGFTTKFSGIVALICIGIYFVGYWIIKFMQIILRSLSDDNI